MKQLYTNRWTCKNTLGLYIIILMLSTTLAYFSDFTFMTNKMDKSLDIIADNTLKLTFPTIFPSKFWIINLKIFWNCKEISKWNAVKIFKTAFLRYSSQIIQFPHLNTQYNGFQCSRTYVQPSPLLIFFSSHRKPHTYEQSVPILPPPAHSNDLSCFYPYSNQIFGYFI